MSTQGNVCDCCQRWNFRLYPYQEHDLCAYCHHFVMSLDIYPQVASSV